MVIWTPADNGRGGGKERMIGGDFIESPVREEQPAKEPSPDLVFIEVEDTPCQPRAVADEEWCERHEAAIARRNARR